MDWGRVRKTQNTSEWGLTPIHMRLSSSVKACNTRIRLGGGETISKQNRKLASEESRTVQ